MASIQKRSNGKYLVRWRNETNKERSQQFDLKRDAKRYAAEIEQSLATGSYVDPKAGLITLQEFYAEWKLRQLWLPNTVKTMDQSIRAASFSGVSLNKIRKSHLESWVKSMEKTLAVGTIHTRFRNVKTTLQAAVGDGLLLKDPTVGVKLPRRNKRTTSMRIPTSPEVKTLLDSAEDWFEPFVALCAFAGLRRGEAAAVKLADIDFLGRTIHVSRQIQDEPKGKYTLRPPKYGSDRVIPIADDLATILSEHIRNIGTYTDEAYLFPGAKGLPMSQHKSWHHWKLTTERGGMKNVRIHDLRHFFASGLIASNCDVVTVQKAMGHAAASTTLDTYSHLWPDANDRTRVAIGGLMKDVLEPHEDQVRTEIEQNPS